MVPFQKVAEGTDIDNRVIKEPQVGVFEKATLFLRSQHSAGGVKSARKNEATSGDPRPKRSRLFDTLVLVVGGGGFKKGQNTLA